jgi:hypothetical protein
VALLRIWVIFENTRSGELARILRGPAEDVRGREMFGLGLFVAGFASGWVVRSTVESSRDLAVSLVATAYGAYEGTKRVVAVEREHMEDLFAEARARYEAKRARAARTAHGPNVADVPRVRQERAA